MFTTSGLKVHALSILATAPARMLSGTHLTFRALVKSIPGIMRGRSTSETGGGQVWLMLFLCESDLSLFHTVARKGVGTAQPGPNTGPSQTVATSCCV